ncbi:MAG: DUF2948 family protein [Hyphomonadaceae bacterium]
MKAEAPLKWVAEDGDDLNVMSAAAQDALVRAGDMRFDAGARRFSLNVLRFRWEADKREAPFERTQAALAFDSVLGVRTKRLRRDAPDALAQILSIAFEADAEPPGGVVRIVLAGGGEIALDVECVDAALIDVGESWRTGRRPDHELEPKQKSETK